MAVMDSAGHAIRSQGLMQYILHLWLVLSHETVYAHHSLQLSSFVAVCTSILAST